MQEKNLSPWFSVAEQTPWEPGVYEVACKYGSGRNYFSYWCGVGFHGGWVSVERAIENKNKSIEPAYQKWRGLAFDPSAKPKPKPRGNRKVTRYVVMDRNRFGEFKGALAVFSDAENARLYAEECKTPVRIQKIRFRTPEAD